MTDEELDKARAQEAWRLYGEQSRIDPDFTAVTAARLAREGWKPADPDLLAVREFLAVRAQSLQTAADYRAGELDYSATLIKALDFYKLGKAAR